MLHDADMVEPPRHNNRVLIVDDQKDIHDDFEEMLKPRRASSADELAAAFLTEEQRNFLPEFELLHAADGEEAFAAVAAGRRDRRPIAVAYIDIRMPPGIDGVEAVRRIRKIDREVEIVMMTAYTDTPLPEIVQDMELLHKLLYVRKPFAREEVQQMTLALVEKWNVERELGERRRQLHVSHQRLEAVLDAIGEAIAMYDRTERVVFANRWYERLLGATEQGLKAMDSAASAANWRRRFRTAIVPDVDRRFPAEDGGDLLEHLQEGRPDRLFYRRKSPVHDDQGEMIGDLYVYRDLSTEIEAERMKSEVLRLRAELSTKYSFAGIVGSSAAMRQVYGLMKRAQEGDVTVLIRGESGTGKELVAKSLHFNGARRNGPFLAVNCAAVPDSLIESELFGHEKGAFTGATQRRIGCFERAHGGTILLDEIGDMQPALQAKLLRVLQEREIQRVGGAATIAVDVQVIAATNQNLEEAMRAGRFRDDLFYRIAAFPIVIPPLRERREDIPLLANHFLKKQAESNPAAPGRISAGALQLLAGYGWPGNVREMESAIARAVLLEATDVLQAGNLPPQIVAAPERGAGPEAGAADDPSAAVLPPGVLPLAVAERRAIARALAAADNNVTQAARALGINRSTLHRKLKKHDLIAGGHG